MINIYRVNLDYSITGIVIIVYVLEKKRNVDIGTTHQNNIIWRLHETKNKKTWNIGTNWENECMILSVAQHFISKSREQAYLEILFLY